jgi:hypothetical protein
MAFLSYVPAPGSEGCANLDHLGPSCREAGDAPTLHPPRCVLERFLVGATDSLGSLTETAHDAHDALQEMPAAVARLAEVRVRESRVYGL